MVVASFEYMFKIENVIESHFEHINDSPPTPPPTFSPSSQLSWWNILYNNWYQIIKSLKEGLNNLRRLLWIHNKLPILDFENGDPIFFELRKTAL